MILLLLTLATVPQTSVVVSPQVAPDPRVFAQGSTVSGSIPNRAITPSACRSGLTLAANAMGPRGDLMWREGGQPVRMYRLLERRVNGCAAPIVVMEWSPGTDAAGREIAQPPASGAQIVP